MTLTIFDMKGWQRSLRKTLGQPNLETTPVYILSAIFFAVWVFMENASRQLLKASMTNNMYSYL